MSVFKAPLVCPVHVSFNATLVSNIRIDKKKGMMHEKGSRRNGKRSDTPGETVSYQTNGLCVFRGSNCYILNHHWKSVILKMCYYF